MLNIMNDMNRQTKKKKNNISKAVLWGKIEENFKNTKPIECVYRTCGQRENCDNCESPVKITADGFLVCSNKKCSIIYRDIIFSGLSIMSVLVIY